MLNVNNSSPLAILSTKQHQHLQASLDSAHASNKLRICHKIEYSRVNVEMAKVMEWADVETTSHLIDDLVFHRFTRKLLRVYEATKVVSMRRKAIDAVVGILEGGGGDDAFKTLTQLNSLASWDSTVIQVFCSRWRC